MRIAETIEVGLPRSKAQNPKHSLAARLVTAILGSSTKPTQRMTERHRRSERPFCCEYKSIARV